MPTVLIVDDRELNLELMAAYLAGVDVQVLEARDGAAALELVASKSPDLVLLDVMMPGLGGLEVCRRIKQNPATRLLPVVIVTALNQTEDRVSALDAGADDFIAKPVDRLELVARVRSLLRLKQTYDRLDDAERVIIALARAVEAKDHQTESHTERVGRAARELGQAAGLAGRDLEDLYLGGVIHDIGKIGVPDAILLKQGPLTVAERRVMQRHVEVGDSILRPLRSAAGLAPIVRHHHERIDGSGYPDRLAGDGIPLPARIVAICDAYDAMTSVRPYRPPLSPAQADRELRLGAGTQWDRALVETFLGAIAGRRLRLVSA